MSKMSEAAGRRNFAKGKLISAINSCKSMSDDGSITPKEKYALRQVCNILQGVVGNWRAESEKWGQVQAERAAKEKKGDGV